MTGTSSRASMEDMEKHLGLSDLAARSSPQPGPIGIHWHLEAPKILRTQVVCQKTCAIDHLCLDGVSAVLGFSGGWLPSGRFEGTLEGSRGLPGDWGFCDSLDSSAACEDKVAHEFESCRHPDFRKLRASQAQILRREDLGVSREEAVLKSIFNWLKISKEDGSLGMLLQLVGFHSALSWPFVCPWSQRWRSAARSQGSFTCSAKVMKSFAVASRPSLTGTI